MSHEERMRVIDKEGAGDFALEEERHEDVDHVAVARSQETMDVSEIVVKYDKKSVYRTFKGWMDILIRLLCIAFSAFHLYIRRQWGPSRRSSSAPSIWASC